MKHSSAVIVRTNRDRLVEFKDFRCRYNGLVYFSHNLGFRKCKFSEGFLSVQDTNLNFDMTLPFLTVALLTARIFIASQWKMTIHSCIVCWLFHLIR